MFTGHYREVFNTGHAEQMRCCVADGGCQNCGRAARTRSQDRGEGKEQLGCHATAPGRKAWAYTHRSGASRSWCPR